MTAAPPVEPLQHDDFAARAYADFKALKHIIEPGVHTAAQHGCTASAMSALAGQKQIGLQARGNRFGKLYGYTVGCQKP